MGTRELTGECSERERRLEEAVLEYSLAADAGHAPAISEFVARYPEVAEELRAFLAVQVRLSRLIPPLRPSLFTAEFHPGDGTPDGSVGEMAAHIVPPAPPGYEVLGLLGRGGMGIVYKAQQVRLNREVALKVILTGAHASAEERVRFLAEAEAAAALAHPHVVQIHECGVHDGQPYLALEYCPGGSLAARLNGTPLPSKEAAALVEQLSQAVQAAHERGIVHRDLKPGNILFAADWSPRVSDFSLAKRVEGGAGLTATGVVLGTPSYMAPEQARGEKGVGPAADVYALGAILYECLTGRPPFKAATPVETVLQVLEQEVVSVRSLNLQVSADLETVCHKCLQKEVPKRYASAAALADDLRRFLDGRPILARPVGALGRAVRWGRRKPVVAGLTAALALALLLGGAGVVREYRRADRERDAAVTARDRSDRLLGQARDALSEMIDLGQRLVHVPATVGQGEDILEVARRYNSRLLDEDPDNVANRERAVPICRKLALLYTERGEWDKADGAWTEAARHAAALLDGPDGDRHRAGYVELVYKWEEQLFYQERFALVVEVTDRACAVARALDAERPDDPAAALGVVELLFWRGMALRQVGRGPDAEATLRDGLAVMRRRGRTFADRYGITHEANYLNQLQEGYLADRRLVEAEAYAREAVALVRAALARQPADRNAPLTLAAMQHSLGRALYEQQRWQAAVDELRASNRLFAARPLETAERINTYQRYLRAAGLVARALDRLGRPDEAIPDLRAAVGLTPTFARVGVIDPTPPELFECYARLIELTARRGEAAEARRLYAEALKRRPEGWPGANAANQKWAAALQALAKTLAPESP